MARRRPAISRFAIGVAACIRPARAGWRRTSSFTTRSTGTTATSCCCRPASTTSRTHAVPSIVCLSATSKSLRPRSTAKHFACSGGSIWPRPAGISGDHHVHAAGCAHYSSPTQGVQPADMMRHIVGEDLNVGCVLTWGPCWYHQKQFFDGKVSPLSTPRNLMRYDVEVSGFPSSHAGHVVSVAAYGGRLSGHEADRRLAELGPADSEVGQGAGRRGRFRAQRLGPGSAWRYAADVRHAARSTALARTNTSSM